MPSPTANTRDVYVWPAIGAFIAAVAAVVAAAAFERRTLSDYQHEVREDVVRELANVRAAAEMAINQRVFLTLALKSYVSVNPDITPQEFADFSALLMEQSVGIRSVTSIRDNVIDDVYPREGNEAAIGLKLLEHPEQRAAAKYAIETGQPWLAGPIQLQQGGQAFVNRAPVRVTEPGESPGGGRYWGMVSILIDRDMLVEETTRNLPRDLRIAVRGRDGFDQAGPFFLGGEEIMQVDPIESEISLPTGSWKLYGVPDQGWPTFAPGASTRLAMAVLVASLAASLVFGMLYFAIAYRNYSRVLEVAEGEATAARREAEEANRELSNVAEALQHSNEQLEFSNAELKQFAYAASHDIQAPLRGVAGFAQFLAEDYRGKLGDEADSWIDEIVSGCDRMKRLIRDLLSYSRVDLSESPTETTCSLQELFDDAMAMLRTEVETANAIVTADEFPSVACDASQMSRVFLNLIGNALKYRGDEQVRIHVGVASDDKYWTISVQDNGVGMRPEDCEKSFEVFKRCHSSSEYEGTGIGLAICSRIIRRHGGRIWAESELGKGSTFSFTLLKTDTEVQAS